MGLLRLYLESLQEQQQVRNTGLKQECQQSCQQLCDPNPNPELLIKFSSMTEMSDLVQ